MKFLVLILTSLSLLVSSSNGFVVSSTSISFYQGYGDEFYTVNGTVGDNHEIVNLQIPSVYNNLPVYSIGEMSLAYIPNLTSVVIDNGVRNIGYEAFFDDQSLIDVFIPDSVTNIGGNVFGQCFALESVRLSQSLESIAPGLFWECRSLQEITIPDSVTSIGDLAFHGCSSLNSIIFEGNAPTLGDNAFGSSTSVIYHYENATGFDSSDWDGLNLVAIPVPEPSSYALLLGSLALGLVAVLRR